MILQAKQRLEDRIVRALVETTDQTAYELHKRVCTAKRSYSLQGLYKELRKLQQNGVVVKTRGIYSLRLPWILNLLSLSERAARTNINDHHMELPKKNGRIIWHFNDLLKMNDFWSHILLLLIQQSKQKTILGWNPHPWFHLVQTEQEQQYIDSLRILKSKLCLIIGGNSYLDRSIERFLEKDVVRYSFYKGKLGFKRTEYINCIGDFVLTVKMVKKTAGVIDALYDLVKKPEDIDISSILKIFRQPTSVSMWLENKPAKAHATRVKFKKFFGKL